MTTLPALDAPGRYLFTQYGRTRVTWRALANDMAMSQVRSEDMVVAVLDALLQPTVPAAVRQVVIEALLASAPQKVRAAVLARGPLVSRVMVGTRRPDLLLVTETTSQAVCVVEAKMMRGKMQASLFRHVQNGPWWGATGLATEAQVRAWAAQDPAGEVWQIDLACAYSGYCPADVDMDPQTVTWIWWTADPDLTPSQAYPDALTAHAWVPTRHAATAQHLGAWLVGQGYLDAALQPTYLLDLAHGSPEGWVYLLHAALMDPWR